MNNQPILSGVALLTVLATACVPETQVPASDTQAPTLSEVTPVSNPSHTNTPNYTFHSSEAGTIAYGGSCSSSSTDATSGNNTITLDNLGNGTYSNCTISVTDSSGNTSVPLSISEFTTAWLTRPLNDTGQSNCGDSSFLDSTTGYEVISASGTHNNDLNCSGISTPSSQSSDGAQADGDMVRAGQDAVYGRDSDISTNSDSDGHKGFSFTKLDATGSDISIDCSVYDLGANGGDDNGSLSQSEAQTCHANSSWVCVKDNVTNLIWEIKSTTSLRSSSNTYSWYNSTGTNDGGNAGTENSGSCSGGSGCDTEKYTADVNALNICGETSNDWRLPTKQELSGIISNDRVNPSIDVGYFPHIPASFAYYWTSSPYAANSGKAWNVDFNYGYASDADKSGNFYIRLVRDAQ